MALPAIKSFLRKTLSRSSTKKRRSPSSSPPSSPSTAPHRSSSKRPTATSKEEGIDKASEGQAAGGDGRSGVRDDTMSSASSKSMPADEKIGVAKTAESKEGEGDVSSVKKKGIGKEESFVGESKSKDHEIHAATEGQEEHKMGEGKLETPPPNLPTPETLDKKEVEKMSKEQAEGRKLEDHAAPSTHSKPMPADGDMRAGEKPVKVPERSEGEGDVSSVKNEVIPPPSSSSSPTSMPTNEASSEGESKSKHHEIIAASEGQEEHRMGEGKLETPPLSLPTPEILEKDEVERTSEEQAARRNVKGDAVPADGDIRAGEKPVQMPERSEGEGEVSSVKNKVITPPSSLSPTLLPTNEASPEGESKSREHKDTVEREGQVELTEGQSKPKLIPSNLPTSGTLGKGEIERTHVGEAEINNVETDSISSTSSKHMPANEGIGVGEMFAKMPDRNEEKGDTTSIGKNEFVMPSSPPMLVPTSEASSEGESKSKEHDSTVARDDQDEHKRDESKLEHFSFHFPTPETLGQGEIERTSEEQAERRDAKGDASSTSLKQMPQDKKIQAGEAGVSSSPMPSTADEEKMTKGDDMTLKRKAEEADTNGGSTAEISPPSLEPVKIKEYGSFGGNAGEGGIKGTSQGQGDQGGERSNLEEATMSSTSLQPMPAANDEIPRGDRKLSSTEAIFSSSIPAAEDEEMPTKSGDMIPKRNEGDSPLQLSMPTNEMSSMAEEQKEPKIGEPKPKIADGQEGWSNGSEGIVPSPSPLPLPLPTSKQSSTADSKIEESETKFKGKSTSEETKLSQTIAEDKRMLEGEETMKGGSITEITPSPSGRSSTEEPKTTAGREGQEEEHSIPKQPSVSSALPMSTKPSNKELQEGMTDPKEQIKHKAIIKKTEVGLKEEMKGTPKMVGIISKPSYDGAIPSAPALKDDDEESEAERNGRGEGASEWRMSGTKLGVIAMVTAIVCMGTVVLMKRLENIRRRKLGN